MNFLFFLFVICVLLAVAVLVVLVDDDDDDDDHDDDTTTNKKTSLQTEVYGVLFCPLKVRHGGVQMEVWFKQALFSTKHFSRVRRQLEQQRKAKKQRKTFTILFLADWRRGGDPDASEIGIPAFCENCP